MMVYVIDSTVGIGPQLVEEKPFPWWLLLLAIPLIPLLEKK